MRAAAMPGEDPATVTVPEDIASKVVEMLSPEFDRNGVIYDYRAGGFLTFDEPDLA